MLPDDTQGIGGAGAPQPLELGDRQGCYEYDDNRAYGGPYDGGVLDVINDYNTIMFRFGAHLGAARQGHCDGLFHVYQRHIEPVRGVGDAWVYVGVKTMREVESQ